MKTQSKSLILKVSKLHGERLHVEIPKKDRKDFQEGEHVVVEKVVLTSSNDKELFSLSELIAGSDKIKKAKIMKAKFDSLQAKMSSDQE
jgi:hypothetical protein